MYAQDNSTLDYSTWIQTGGQDPNMEVDYFSRKWWWAQRDRRSDSYPLLNSPYLVISISLAYAVFVKWFGPWLMRDRKPFSLKNTLLAYNLFQVVLSIYMVIEAWDAGWGRHYSWSKLKVYHRRCNNNQYINDLKTIC